MARRARRLDTGLGQDPNVYTNRTGNLDNDRTHMFRVQEAV
jgi:hypothetical protein